MIWGLVSAIGKAVVTAARFLIPEMISSTAYALSATVRDNEALAQQSEDLQLAQLKLQYLQHQDTLKFQARQAQLSHERAKELQAFIQRAEDIRLQKSLDFQRWCLEQEKALQLELCDRNLQLQRDLAAYQRQTYLKIVEEQKRLENSPIWLVASNILNSHSNEEKIPLRIFLAPPKLQFERFSSITNAANNFPDIELTLAEGLRQFLRNYSIAGRPIDFLAGAWTSKSFHSEASIKALFGVLKSEPTLVLESEIDGDYLNFRIAFWNSNATKYRYEPIISKLSYGEILKESAKARAQKWLKTKETLIATGESPEEVDKLYGGDNVKNLEIWQREKRFQKAGLDLSELEFNYIINKKDFEELCQFIVIYHCIFAGLLCDEYFLFQYNLPPLLPQIIHQLIKENSNPEIIQELIDSVVLYYQNLYQALRNTRSTFLPELILDLAHSLAILSNKEWAKQQVINSIKAWLKLRNFEQSDDLSELLDAIASVLKLEDKDYVEKLKQCLLAIGEDRQLKINDDYYQRGINYCQREEYQNAIESLTRAIELNLNLADAYYNRGLAYTKLEQYSKAIADYTQALQFNSNWKDAYNNRGNAYYKLGEHEKAIADYEQAIKIDSNFEVAIQNKAIAEQELRDRKRKQEEEENHKREELKRKQEAEQRQNEELKRRQEAEENRRRRLENFSVVNTLTGHNHFVRYLAISPDGKLLASGSFDCSVKLWDLQTGKEIRTLKGNLNKVEALAISPDGETLATCGYTYPIKLWNIKTGYEIRAFRDSSYVNAVVFSPDGKILASATANREIQLWDVVTGNLLRTLKGGKRSQTLEGHCDTVRTLAFSPDGRTLASGSFDSTIKLWTISTVLNVNTGLAKLTLRKNSEAIYSVIFSPDGQTIFSSGTNIEQWANSNGKPIKSFLGHSRYIFSLAISPDGQTLASGGEDETIKIWQVSTGKELRTLTGHSGAVYCLAISPDGKTLVSGSADKTIKIWQLP